MIIHSESFDNLPFSRLFKDYVQNSGDILPFFSSRHTYADLKKAVLDYRFRGDRSQTVRLMKSCNRGIPLRAAARAHIEALDNPNTLTITTGQQLGLFGGPLYTVYKTLSLIHLAKHLSRDTGKKIVPVFWLADEDHDYDEIAHVHIPAGSRIRTFSAEANKTDGRAAGSIRLNGNFESFRSEVYAALPESDFSGPLKELLSECYTTGRTVTEAFAHFMAHLFSEHGLIFAKSHHPEVKSSIRDLLRENLENADYIHSVLEAQSKKLAQLYHQQAHLTGSLLFLHDPGKGRTRLDRINGNWSDGTGRKWSDQDMLRLVDEEPELFSPNVFLRPILQDTLLPNAAYIAGPAEVAYYAQMRPLFELYRLKMPFIASRFSATLLEPGISRLMGHLPFDFSEYLHRTEDLEKKFLLLKHQSDLDPFFSDWAKEISELSEARMKQTGCEDPGLIKLNRSLSKEYEHALGKLKKKIIKHRKQKEEIQIRRIAKVQQALFPDGQLQERRLSFIYFMSKYGLNTWDNLVTSLPSPDKGLFSQHYLLKL